MWWSAQWRALCTKITEVNLFAFAYRLFHEDFSPILGAIILFLVLVRSILEQQIFVVKLGWVIKDGHTDSKSAWFMG